MVDLTALKSILVCFQDMCVYAHSLKDYDY